MTFGPASLYYHHHMHFFAQNSAAANAGAQIANAIDAFSVFEKRQGTESDVGRMISNDSACRAFLIDTTTARYFRRFYYSPSETWLFNTARAFETYTTAVDSADIAFLKGFMFGVNCAEIAGLTTANVASRFQHAFLDRVNGTQRSSYYNYESKYVVSQLIEKVVDSVLSGSYFGEAGFDAVYFDNGAVGKEMYTGNSLTTLRSAVNKDYGGSGSYSDWWVGRAEFLAGVQSALSVFDVSTRTGYPRKVFTNIWQGGAYFDPADAKSDIGVKYTSYWWTTGSVRLDHYYLEGGWEANQNDHDGVVPSGYPFEGEPAFISGSWGHLPCAVCGQMNTPAAAGSSASHTYMDILGATTQAAKTNAWFGWHAAAAADPTAAGTDVYEPLVRVIPNWDKLRGINIASVAYNQTSASRYYSSSYSYASNSKFVYSFKWHDNELWAIFARTNSDRIPLISGQNSIVSAYTTNKYWTKTTTDLTSVLTIAAGYLYLTDGTYLTEGMRIVLNDVTGGGGGGPPYVPPSTTGYAVYPRFAIGMYGRFKGGM